MLITDTDKTEAENVYENFCKVKELFTWKIQNITMMEIKTCGVLLKCTPSQ